MKGQVQAAGRGGIDGSLQGRIAAVAVETDAGRDIIQRSTMAVVVVTYVTGGRTIAQRQSATIWQDAAAARGRIVGDGIVAQRQHAAFAEDAAAAGIRRIIGDGGSGQRHCALVDNAGAGLAAGVVVADGVVGGRDRTAIVEAMEITFDQVIRNSHAIRGNRDSILGIVSNGAAIDSGVAPELIKIPV